MRLFQKLFSLIAAAWLLGVASAVAQTNDRGPSLSLIEENDFVAGTDRHYTQGLKITYLHSDGFLPGAIANVDHGIPSWGFEHRASQFGYQLGQSIYTPENLGMQGANPADRPYAGWLYAGLILQRRGTTAGELPLQESLELQLGVIGPWSAGEEAQRWTHVRAPQGWRNQLKTEPGLNLRYQRSARYGAQLFESLEAEFIPHGGVSLGNVDTSLRLGGQVRLGANLPDDFGVQGARSLASPSGGCSPEAKKGRLGLYFFGGADGRVVLRDTFLDGNLFHSGPSVDKRYVAGDLSAGVVLEYLHWEIGYTHFFLTPEFRGQQGSDSYGSAYFKWCF